MNRYYALALLVLVGVAGCSRKKNKQTKKPRHAKTEVFSEVDIPMADQLVHNLLDEDLREFKVIDEASTQVAANSFDQVDDFRWMDDASQEDAFKIVYFDFDRDVVRKDQETNVAHNISLAKRALEEAQIFGDEGSQPVFVVEGHACNSAGRAVYNLALSERRAKVIADRLAAAGIPRKNIKIKGLGSEVPALVNGKPVIGGREEQAPNRRDEFRILYA